MGKSSLSRGMGEWWILHVDMIQSDDRRRVSKMKKRHLSHRQRSKWYGIRRTDDAGGRTHLDNCQCAIDAAVTSTTSAVTSAQVVASDAYSALV